jgi:translation initiation factor IF-2
VVYGGDGIDSEEWRLQQQKDKIRVYALARELKIELKDVLQYCKELGFEVKNQLSSLDPEQCDQLKLRIQRGNKAAPSAPAPVRPPITTQSLDTITKVRNLGPSRPRPSDHGVKVPTADEPAQVEESAPEPDAIVQGPEPKPTQELVAPAAATAPTPVVAPAPPEVEPTRPTPAPSPEPAATPAVKAATPSAAPAAPRPPQPPTMPADRGMRDLSGGRPRDLGRPGPTPAPSGGGPAAGPGPARTPESTGPTIIRRSHRSIRPTGSGIGVPKAAPQTPLRNLAQQQQQAKAAGPTVVAPKSRLSDEQMQRLRDRDVSTKTEMQKVMAQPTAAPAAPVAEGEEEDDDKKKKGAATGGGGIPGRNERHEKRKERAQKRKENVAVAVVDGRVDIIEEQERIRRRKAQAHKKHRQPGTVPRVGKIPIQSPITVRALSEAIGWKVGKLQFQLMSLGAPKSITINTVIDDETAETIALEAGLELDIRRIATAEEKVLAAAAVEDTAEQLVLRAPIVTVMGHVDHGKTSLLDKIRRSEVAKGEVGGITQVIRAWRVEHNGKPITFLDTPGHEAFTKMRARGAQVTDIAVIVVAVTDGVQPQTEEAIAHAKAAGVQIVVALNKIDMPNANINKTRQQLYSLDVLPDDMGGDTPFVETSAATGQGIDELLETLAVAAELRELKANPNKPASGTCIEAHKEGDEGVFATLLVQQGTLRKGDVVLCGASYGRVRAMYDDQGKSIDEAGPSVPVRITGLDDVPEASDTFHVVPELATAREISEKRKEKKVEAALYRHQPLTLELLAQKKVTEVKVILKADFRGSIEAIRKELEKLKHEEVRARILHAGIGAVTESDVQLALASPEDTLVIGFNAVPDNQALALAESRGIKIREYNIIYNLTDDIKSAMEGKLKPREEIIHLGRALVREVFKISRVGTVAGCHVTSGTIERSAKVRLIREGVVVFPAADKVASLDSLKRFKDDVREVREGMECGMKITNYDDIKVGDVIEAYKIEQVMRTL